VEIFKEMEFDDWWDEADLKSVYKYLRGCKGLKIPAEYKPLLPTTI
jgi:hypothetical protein